MNTGLKLVDTRRNCAGLSQHAFYPDGLAAWPLRDNRLENREMPAI
jgi:hypothetical protein